MEQFLYIVQKIYDNPRLKGWLRVQMNRFGREITIVLMEMCLNMKTDLPPKLMDWAKKEGLDLNRLPQANGTPMDVFLQMMLVNYASKWNLELSGIYCETLRIHLMLVNLTRNQIEEAGLLIKNFCQHMWEELRSLWSTSFCPAVICGMVHNNILAMKQHQRSHRSNRNVLREEKEMDSKGTGPTYDKLRSPETTRKTFTSTSDLNGLQSTRRSNQTNGSMSELPNDVSSNTISSTKSSSIEGDNATKLCRVSSTCYSADEVRHYLSKHVDPSDEDTIANFYKTFGKQIMEFNYLSNTETLEINSRRYNILEEHYEYYQKSKCLVLGTVENIAAWVVYDFNSKEIYLTSHVGDSKSNLDGSEE